ncbi:MAG TPA: protein-L-isoaspartate(D-aspartate) O-methyltransferase [Opitutaceae bacterium]|nr:protein-L-isoaspartate(D-aspartate) O-methyltransferase [Opitutaceae bacterium]
MLDPVFGGPEPGESAGERRAERRAMVVEQLAARDIVAPRVLAAMEAVPRHRFVPVALRAEAYDDEPLPIGHGQTISQPYIVALMTQLLAPAPGDRVLEIGTGCGYQTAVLAGLAGEVCTMEIVAELARRAEATLAGLGVANVACRIGDGRRGWPERAPFAGIIVTAAPCAVERAWGEQLAEGGRIVVPLGGRYEQWLHRFTKRGPILHDERLLAVRFVPLVGAAADARRIG